MQLKSEIIATLQSLPEITNWPEVATFFHRASEKPNVDWYIPIHTCRAVGGASEIGLWGAIAIACLQVSIILVDDMLDEDPRGLHVTWQAGPTANMALALQAAPFRLLNQLALEPDRRVAVADCLGHIALATATGQHLDVQNLDGEENYWRVVKAKSTPFYGGAYKLGALLGGADDSVAESLYKFGVLIGEIIQIQDDLEDALEYPANADWQQGRNNLLLLYARHAEYNEKKRFLQLFSQVDDNEKLREAQQILMTSGATSYALYLLTEKYDSARMLLNSLPLSNPVPLSEMLDSFLQVLKALLGKSYLDVPDELFA